MSTEVILVVVVQLIVGGILWNQIRSQSAVLGHYKDLLASIDPGKMKTHMEIIEQAAEMKHKVLAAKEVERISEEAFKTGRMVDEQFGLKYNEMMGVHLYHIGKLNGPEREQALTWFPHCANDMRKHLAAQVKQNADKQAK